MLLSILYVIAITAEAMTGALSAGSRNMDWFGVVLIACVTALGGGSVRDMLLGHYPLGWVAHPEYLLICAFAALITIFIAPLMRHLKNLFLVLDAIGLVVFTIIGCQIAMQMQLSMTIAMVSGVITGVFGGIIRDTLCNDVPLVFRRELYASIAILTASIYLLAGKLGMPENSSVILAIIVGFLVRLMAIYYKWEVPKFIYREDIHDALK